MNDATRSEGRQPLPSQTITAFDPHAGPRPSSRPCMALVTSSGPHRADDIRNLLRSRLRVAGLIGLGGFGLFFLKVQLFPAHTDADASENVRVALHGILVALLISL